jgi:integrase/recombinase XerD
MAIAPLRDWDWLKRRLNRLYAIADDERRQRPLALYTGDIFDKARKALTLLEQSGLRVGLASAVEYRNWLMVATITLMPLRRRNFSALSIVRHLRRNRDIWSIEIPAEETKQNRAIEMPVPSVLLRHFRYYFDCIRPILLSGQFCDNFWISVRHTPMTDHSVYVSMTKFTRDVFGESINPHRFRHIASTTTVVAAPEMLESARALLTHGDSKITRNRYIVGQSLAASRQHARLISKLRRTLDDTGNTVDVART